MLFFLQLPFIRSLPQVARELSVAHALLKPTLFMQLYRSDTEKEMKEMSAVQLFFWE